jgi:hypothetical protein
LHKSMKKKEGDTREAREKNKSPWKNGAKRSG